MAKIKQVMNCGCLVAVDYNNAVEIVYCPKHRSAPDLYEALKIGKGAVETDLFYHPEDKVSQIKLRIIVKALSKAEGK